MFTQLSAQAHRIQIADYKTLADTNSRAYNRIKENFNKDSVELQDSFLTELFGRLQSQKHPLALSRWYRLKAYNSFLRGDHALALHNLELGLEAPGINEMDYEIIAIQTEKVTVYEYLGLYAEAIELYQEVIERELKINNAVRLSDAFHRISSLKLRAEKYEEGLTSVVQSLYYLNKVPKEKITQELERSIMSVNNTAGLLSARLKLYNEALTYYEQAEKKAIALQDVFWEALINGNKATVYFNLNKMDEALPLLLKDFKASVAQNEWGSAINAAESISKIYLHKNKHREAKIYLDSAYLILNSQDKHSIEHAQQQLLLCKAEIEYNRHIGDKGRMIVLLEKLIHLKEQSDSEEMRRRLSEAQVRLQLTKRQAEIEKLTVENELRRFENEKQKYVLLFSAIAAFLLLILVFILWTSMKRKSNNLKIIVDQQKEILQQKETLETQGYQLQQSLKKVQELNQQLTLRVEERTRQYEKTFSDLDFFLYRSSHDTRRPITTLQGLLQLLEMSPSENGEIIGLMKDTVRSMDHMLLKLQMVYLLNGPERNPLKFDIMVLAEETVKKIQREFSLGEGQIRVWGNGRINYDADPLLFQIILGNILENACLYAYSKEAIGVAVNITKDQENVSITIADKGIGIQPDILPKIFNLYFRGTERSKGNGLGLYLVHQAVKQLKGTITVESRPDEGAVFTIRVPVTA